MANDLHFGHNYCRNMGTHPFTEENSKDTEIYFGNDREKVILQVSNFLIFNK
jgi:hypothetical protein